VYTSASSSRISANLKFDKQQQSSKNKFSRTVPRCLWKENALELHKSLYWMFQVVIEYEISNL
jgi:hypothetical protein